MELTGLLNRIINEHNIVFYGAQMVASSVYTALKTICNPNVKCFIVTSLNNNPQKIDGIEVIDIERYTRQNTNELILIATPIVHHAWICDILKAKGLNNYICIDSSLENAILAKYYMHISRFRMIRNHKPDELSVSNKSISIYMVKSPVDSKLSCEYTLPEWYVSILAGAALSEQRDAQVYDNIGENISEKNRNYCELTATYWVWKHADSDYVGISHYRRIFDLVQPDLDSIFNRDIDVILPMPTISYPNAEEHHKRYITDDDWNALKIALREVAPEYEKLFSEVFEDIYFYNFNILVAKKCVFDRFCGWMFPILDKVEQICEAINPNRKNRYMGYIGESLMTLYFMKNMENLSVEHIGNIMLI